MASENVMPTRVAVSITGASSRQAGGRRRIAFRSGDRVRVELVEADPVQGTLLFRLDRHEPGRGAVLARAAWKKGGPRKLVRRARPGARPTRRRS